MYAEGGAAIPSLNSGQWLQASDWHLRMSRDRARMRTDLATLAHDPELKPHRGQVAIVPKIDLTYAIVCDGPPLMYAIPRSRDCVFGGTNEVSDDDTVDPAATAQIVGECSRVLNIDKPEVLSERVGLRPFRRSGVRVERAQSCDGRMLVHNYGHGGSGFTLSWGCARAVAEMTER
jgi:D-amino-acid oxidase